MEAITTRAAAADGAEFGARRGTNQSGMRDLNERLVLSLVRRNGRLAKSDIARMTGLSAQTVSVIMRQLEASGLLRREKPVRGKVGQPSVPMALDPDGAFFLGLKIGRRSAELVMIDFVGAIRQHLRLPYAYPSPGETVRFVRDGIASIQRALTPEQWGRVAGLGVAMPFNLWNWTDSVGAPPEVMDGWRQLDLRAELQSEFPFPVYVQNDATAACGAELVFGTLPALGDFIYFYIGAFAGGGVVLNGQLYSGPGGNAGALGSMPVPGPDGAPCQLIDVASIAVLDKMLQREGRDGSHLWTSPEGWGELGPALDRWIDASAAGLAHAIVSASAVIDFEAAVIDGWMPYPVRARLVEATSRALTQTDAEGLTLPTILEGTVGIHARSLGAASLPLSERFLTAN